MKVKLNQNIKFLYKGVIRLPGKIFDFEGTKPEFLTVVSGAEAKKAEETEARAVAAQDALRARVAIVETEEPDTEEVQESKPEASLLIDDVDFGNLSPDQIKAQIENFESKEAEKVQQPIFKLIKKARGWFDVKDPKGKKITPKKIRRAEAVELIESLGGTFEEK